MQDHDTELQLAALYEKQLARYLELEIVTRRLTGHEIDAARSDDGVMLQIGQLMDQISNIETQVQPLREQWRKVNRKAGPALSATLQHLEKTIKTVMQQIGKAEHEAADAKARLEPQIATEVRRQKMAHAYASAANR